MTPIRDAVGNIVLAAHSIGLLMGALTVVITQTFDWPGLLLFLPVPVVGVILCVKFGTWALRRYGR